MSNIVEIFHPTNGLQLTPYLSFLLRSSYHFDRKIVMKQSIPGFRTYLALRDLYIQFILHQDQ